MSVKFRHQDGRLAILYKDKKLAMVDEGKGLDIEDLGHEAHDFDWSENGATSFLATQAGLASYIHELPISSYNKMERYKADKKQVVRKTCVDPLKLHITMAKLAKLRGEIKRIPNFSEALDRARKQFAHLQKLGFDDKEIEKMLLESKNVLLGEEEYDYYILLQQDLRDVFGGMKIGLKGRDNCLDNFLKKNPVNVYDQTVQNRVDKPPVQEGNWRCNII